MLMTLFVNMPLHKHIWLIITVIIATLVPSATKWSLPREPIYIQGIPLPAWRPQWKDAYRSV